MKHYILAVAIAVQILGLGCGADGLLPTSTPTGSKIPPRAFQFVEVVSDDKDEAGGWQIACIHALIGQGLPDQAHVASRMCEIQSQVPLRTKRQGVITRRKAQYASSKAANAAAYLVLVRSVGVSEQTCIDIRVEMMRLLRQQIDAALVTRCRALPGGGGQVSAPPVQWP